MKVFSAREMKEAEEQAYREGASEEAFMEQAGAGIARVAEEYRQQNQLSKNILLLCAKGNNSGDAYVAGRYLIQSGCKVHALQSVDIKSCSPLCVKNYKRFLEMGGKIISQFPEIIEPCIILDGLFGTGFKGSLEEPFSSIVRAANVSMQPILAIDIPSGLNGDTGEVLGEVIRAQETIFLGAPKKGFFLNEGWKFVGKLRYVDFGLPKKHLDAVEAKMIMLTPELVLPYLPPIKRTWHKYERGYVTGLAGSPDMPGAAILASWAALKAGAGIVRLIHPPGMDAELAAAPLELVRQTYHQENLEPIIDAMEKSSASFIGPGMGRTGGVVDVLKFTLSHISKPSVIDADALTMISENEIPVPKLAILTPHQGEMLKLLGQKSRLSTTEKLLELSQKMIEENEATLVLKGAPTFILEKSSPIYVNPRGDPGMATAGSGDVLTGIIAAFLSHHLTPLQAALLGVYVHAVAGEYAAEEKTSRCVIASDIIESLPKAFKELSDM